MIKVSALALLFAITFVFMVACGSSTDENANVANSVGTGPININGANLPPGISNNPIIVNGNQVTGGNGVVNGGTPTPGIPDPANVNVKPKPGATATPGIPSPEEIQRQLRRSVNAPAGQVNVPPPTATNSAPTMRSTNTNGPRTVRKP